MTIFLIAGYVDIHNYPDTSSREDVQRIVIADDTETAEAKFIAALTVFDPFGTSRTPTATEINPAIT